MKADRDGLYHFQVSDNGRRMPITIEECTKSGSGGPILDIHDLCDALCAYNVTPRQLAQHICDFLNAHGPEYRVAYTTVRRTNMEQQAARIFFKAGKPWRDKAEGDPPGYDYSMFDSWVSGSRVSW